MKKQRRHGVMILFCVLVLMLAALTAGCGGAAAPDLMDEQAGQFAAGKTEKDYSIRTSARELSRLIDEYSGGLDIPKGSPMTEDEADAVRGGTQTSEGEAGDASDPFGGTPSGSKEAVGNENEYIQLIHRVILNQEDSVVFQKNSGYQVEPDKLFEVLMQIEREDPLCLSVSNIAYGYYETMDEVTFSFTYLIPKDEMQRMRTETQQEVQRIAGEIGTSGKSAYEMVVEVNDYICDKAEYPKKQPFAPETHCAYGALIDGSAVCEGYALATKLLLNELKIPCDIEFGTCTDGIDHAWNLVQLDGKWYQLDVTWNDGAFSRKEFLLVTDETMKESRVWDESLYPATPDEAYKG